MSYCSSCGSYMPDWAEECPACGAAKSGPKKQRASQAKGGAASAASAAEEPKKESSGEYHYSYKKPSGASKGRGSARRSADRGAFTYDYEEPHANGGAFRYEPGGERERWAGVYRTDAKKNRGLAALCYLPPFFLLSWLLKPKSSFVRYHVNQGLVLTICMIVINIFDFIPFMWVANLFAVVCMVMGLANALGGKRKPLPLIGDITLIK